jgi:1,6-anhydro-N-acetylmuramate kinase
MIVAGIMSGTSADGINVALARVLGRGFRTRFELLAHQEYPFPTPVRRTILSFMNASATVADLARLNFLLGELYARAVMATEQSASIKADLIGCHGQTIYHQGNPAPFLGRKLAVTWQIGEGAVLAARCGVPVVSDFRPADMAAGGKGAPLVPFLDYLLYRHRRRGRIVQNIGGIANLTAIPARATPGDVVAGAAQELLVEEAVPEPGERAALVAQDVHGHGPSAVELADDAVGAHGHLVEGDLGELVGALRATDVVRHLLFKYGHAFEPRLWRFGARSDETTYS